jgi:Sulfotransferase domain
VRRAPGKPGCDSHCLTDSVYCDISPPPCVPALPLCPYVYLTGVKVEMTLPNFIIIGAQKSGTTWVSHRLKQHPQAFLVHGTYFFDNPKNYARGLEWYQRFFGDAAGKKAIGEKTPSYFWGEKFPSSGGPSNVPRRIKQTLPDAKLIVVLRNPVTRAISQFNHSIRSGKLSPFTEIDRALTERDPVATNGLGLLERGLYHRQLVRWLEFFPREQMRILIFERDVVQNPLECLVGLCHFLEINPSFQFKTVRSKENQKLCKAELVLKYYAPPARKLLRPILKRFPQDSFRARPETYSYLTDYYIQENERLARELKIDLSCWQETTAA